VFELGVGSDSSDAAVLDEHCRVFDDGEVAEFCAGVRARGTCEGYKLADIDDGDHCGVRGVSGASRPLAELVNSGWMSVAVSHPFRKKRGMDGAPGVNGLMPGSEVKLWHGADSESVNGQLIGEAKYGRPFGIVSQGYLGIGPLSHK
jgi:hypothetical protein